MKKARLTLVYKIDIWHLYCRYEDVFESNIAELIDKHGKKLLSTRCDKNEYKIKITNPNLKSKGNGLIYHSCCQFSMLYHYKVANFANIDFIESINKDDDLTVSDVNSKQTIEENANDPSKEKDCHDIEDDNLKDFEQDSKSSSPYHNCLIIKFNNIFYYVNSVKINNMNKIIHITGIEIL